MSLTYAEWKWAQENTGHYGWDKNTPLAPSGMPWGSDPFSTAINDQYHRKWGNSRDPEHYPIPRNLPGYQEPEQTQPTTQQPSLDDLIAAAYRARQQPTPQPTPQPAPTAPSPVTPPPPSPTAPSGLTNTPPPPPPTLKPPPQPTPQTPAPPITGAPAPYQRPDMPTQQQGSETTKTATPAPYQRPGFTPTPAPEFKGTMPAPQLMSLEEMMDVVGKRTNLAYDSRIDAKGRGLEEEMLKGEHTKTAIREAYAKAATDLHKAGQGTQRTAASTMRKRGIYDSGLAVNTSNQIHLSFLQAGLQLRTEEAQKLTELAEYLALRERHTNQEVEQMMGEKALFAETLLDEMHQRNQDRGDMLAQREFEQWLAQQHLGAQHEQAQRQQYWQEIGFDAGQVEQEYTRFWNEKLFEWQQYESQLDEYWRQTGFDASMAQQEYQKFMDQANLDWNKYMWESDFGLKQSQMEYQKYMDQAQMEWQKYRAEQEDYWNQVGFDAQQQQFEYSKFMDQKEMDWRQAQAEREDYRWGSEFDQRQSQIEHQKFMDQAEMEWQQHRAEQEDYWRQIGFDAQQQQLEYAKFMDQKEMDWRETQAARDDRRWESEFDQRQHEAEWARIDSMNRWEAEMELARLQYNNQITQQEFNNAMALNDLELKKALYKAQYGTI
jgi:hypothetical protein